MRKPACRGADATGVHAAPAAFDPGAGLPVAREGVEPIRPASSGSGRRRPVPTAQWVGLADNIRMPAARKYWAFRFHSQLARADVQRCG